MVAARERRASPFASVSCERWKHVHSRIHPGRAPALRAFSGRSARSFSASSSSRRAVSSSSRFLSQRGLDDVVPIEPVVPGVEIVLELAVLGLELRDAVSRLRDALPRPAGRLAPSRFFRLALRLGGRSRLGSLHPGRRGPNGAARLGGAVGRALPRGQTAAIGIGDERLVRDGDPGARRGLALLALRGRAHDVLERLPALPRGDGGGGRPPEAAREAGRGCRRRGRGGLGAGRSEGERGAEDRGREGTSHGAVVPSRP